MDIHNYARSVENAFAGITIAEDLSARNREILRNLGEHLLSQNYSLPRIEKYLSSGKRVARIMKIDYDKWTETDIQHFIALTQKECRSPWTIQWYKVFVKRVIQFVHGMYGQEYPDMVKKIKLHFPAKLKKLPNEGDLLTSDEIHKIINACKNSRDRAFIATLAESGCRISELGNMQIKHLVFDNYGAVLNVTGKTGPRNVRVISATSYLATWRSDHPLKNNREAALWVNLIGEHKLVGYSRWRKVLVELARISGIQKRVNPHSFRHARATYLANHLTEFQMNQYLGWKQGSEMPSTYIHLSGKNTDGALLKMYGLQKGESEKQEAKPLQCPRCDSINPHGAQFCVKCGAVLDESTAIALDEQSQAVQHNRAYADKMMEMLFSDKELMASLKKKLLSSTS